MTPTVRVVERRDEWNALVLGLPRPDFRQSWEWGALRATQGWRTLRVAAFAGGDCLAAASTLGRDAPGLGPVFYAPRGPLVADEAAAWDALPALLARLRAETDALFLRASPRVAVEDADALAPLEARGFARLPDLWSFWNTPRNIMRLDLGGGERDLLARMVRKRRQHVSTGARKGITVAIDDSLDALRVFHAMHVAHGRRQRYPVPGWPTLQALHQEFGARGLLAVVAGRVNGELESMLVGIRFGPVAHTLYAASTPAAHRTPVGDLLHWALMRWARDAGCAELDLGASCTGIPPVETHPGYGIYRFKVELGARLTLYAGYYDHVFSPWRYRLARRLERSALPLVRRLAHPLPGRARREPIGAAPAPLPQVS